MHDQMQPDNNMPQGGADHEGAMAKADLFKLANYSVKLFKQIQDGDQLEAWVQAKITKAADYVASVYHYLEYEMKFNEYGEHLANAEVMTESKEALKNKLMEAKAKVKELKKAQAEKLKEKKKVEEGIGGGECACEMCGGTGVVVKPAREVPEAVKEKVRKYNSKAKAMSAAIARVDRNKNGIPDALEGDEELTDEDQGSLKKAGDSYKTAAGGTVTKTATGIKHERDPSSYDDGGDDSDAKSGKGTKSHAKSRSAAEKKSDAPKLKQSPKSAKTWGMKDGEKFDNRDKEESTNEMFGQGVYEGNDGNLANNAKPYDKVTRGDVIAGRLGKDEMGGKKKDKKVKEELKGNQDELDVDGDKKIEKSDLDALRAGKKAKSVKEATGSYSAKDAAAGKDLGKPGKNFAKIAKKAGGGEKGEKIAGAVLKNLRKESTEPQAELIAESAEVARLKELTQKLLG